MRPPPPAQPSSRSTRRTRPGRTSAAVNGANIIVYFGHGNGYPNPYTRDRAHRSGQRVGPEPHDDQRRRATTGQRTMVYCGEKALLGTLTRRDGAAQRQYCSGGPITPAAGLHDGLRPGPLRPGLRRAIRRERPAHDAEPGAAARQNYSTPVLDLGAGGTSPPPTATPTRSSTGVLTQPGSTLRPDLRAGRRLLGVDISTSRRTPTSPAPSLGPAHDHRRLPLRRARLLVRLRR